MEGPEVLPSMVTCASSFPFVTSRALSQPYHTGRNTGHSSPLALSRLIYRMQSSHTKPHLKTVLRYLFPQSEQVFSIAFISLLEHRLWKDDNRAYIKWQYVKS